MSGRRGRVTGYFFEDGRVETGPDDGRPVVWRIDPPAPRAFDFEHVAANLPVEFGPEHTMERVEFCYRDPTLRAFCYVEGGSERLKERLVAGASAALAVGRLAAALHPIDHDHARRLRRHKQAKAQEDIDLDAWRRGFDEMVAQIAALGPVPVRIEIASSIRAQLERSLAPPPVPVVSITALRWNARLLEITIDDDLPHRPEPMMRVHYSDGTSKVVPVGGQNDA